MSSLTTCIKKAGKALSKEDADSIREIAAELGDPKAAIDEYLGVMADERTEITDQVGEQAATTSSKYSLGKEVNNFKEEFLTNEEIDKALGNRSEIAWFLGDEALQLGKSRTIELSTGQKIHATHENGRTAFFVDGVRTAKKAVTKLVAGRIKSIGQEPAEKELRYQIDDDFIEELVDKHPEHPMSQDAKLYALNKKITEKARTSDVRGIWDKMKDMSREAYLASLPQTKLSEVMNTAMPGVPDYVRTIAIKNGFVDDQLAALAETGNTWRALFRSDREGTERMGTVMHEASRAKTDPSKPFELPKTFSKMNKENKKLWMIRKRNHAILKKEWDKLSQTHKDLYVKVREDYKDMRQNVLDELVKSIEATTEDNSSRKALIAEIRAKFEAGKIEPYFPLQRFGKHWGVVTNRETGEVVTFSKFEKSSERDAWTDEWRKQGFNVQRPTESGSAIQDMKRVDPNFVAKIIKLVGKDNTALQDEIWQMYISTMPERSMSKAFIHRVGRLGYSTDALRAYGFNMFHGTHQLGKLKYGHELETHLQNIQSEATMLDGIPDMVKNSISEHGLAKTHADMLKAHPRYQEIFKRLGDKQVAIDEYLERVESDKPWAKPLADEMVLRHEFNMNPMSSVWANNLTALGFFWFLSTSPAAGFLNLTQTWIVGLPTLGARYTMAGAAAELSKASGQLIARKGDFINTLRGDERKAFEELSHIFTKTQTHDLMGYAERGQNFASKWHVAADVTGWIFHHTEKWNREITAIAAYRLARKAGVSHNAAVIEADKMVEKSHFDYTSTNRPRIMQKDAAKVILLFRNFSLNMTYRLAKDFRDGVLRNPNIEPKMRNEAAKRFGGILAMTGVIFSGASGMPLAWAFHGILDAMMGDEDEPYDSQAMLRAHLKEQWGEDISTWIMKGGWDAATGLQISNRASFNNMWIREVPDRLSGKDLYLHLLGEATGPLGGVAMNVFAGAENLYEGHTRRGLEKFVPKFVADGMKTYRYATEGALNYDKDVIMSKEAFTNLELAGQFFGFSPVGLNTIYEQGSATKDHSAALTRRQRNLMNRYFLAVKNKDTAEQKQAITELIEFGKKNPTRAINTKKLRQSARSRARYDALSISGTNVPMSDYHLHDMYDITDDEDDK
jgi:hypothetical protein